MYKYVGDSIMGVSSECESKCILFILFPSSIQGNTGQYIFLIASDVAIRNLFEQHS